MIKTEIAVVLICMAVPSAAQTSKPVAKPTAGSDASTWSPEIRALHDKIVSLPGKPDKPAVRAIRRLASMYPAARAAMESIARKKLPIPHLAVSGGIVVAQYQFADARLRKMALEHPNPFVKMHAVEKLANLGGKERKDYLTKLRPALPRSKVIDAAVARVAPSARYTERQLTLLDQVMRSSDEKTAKDACFAINLNHPALAPVLERITRTVFLSKHAKLYGGIALANIFKEDLPALKRLIDPRRRNHKYVRYNAVLALHKHHGAKGKAHLETLLENPKEPLRPVIEKLLKAKQKSGQTPGK